ncbi:MAG: FG-GAP-like repeat-containing protein [Gemmatimonadales bacterium]
MNKTGKANTIAAVCTVLFACSPTTQWEEGDGYRSRPLNIPKRGHSGFSLLTPRETRITFENNVSEQQALENEHVFNGSGVAAGDVDGDGLVDLYFARLDGPNVLYRNRGGLRFEDATESAGVAAPDRLSTGAMFIDVDGDADLDLLTTSMGGPTSLFVNDGTGVFTDATDGSGLASGFYGTTMTSADVDGDGDLDLYVANNKLKAVRDIYPPDEIAFDRVIRERADGEFEVVEEFREHYSLARQGGRLARFEFAEPDKFYLNDGRGRFEEVPFTAGRFRDASGTLLTQTPRDWGLTARFYDVDDDGDPDLYVTNDFESPDHFWINDGVGNFQMIAVEALRTTSNANMAVDFADIDRDGDVDIFQVDMLDRNSGKQKTQTPNAVPEEGMFAVLGSTQQVPRNTLLLNRGDGTFAEAGFLARIEASGWSWGTTFLDVDLDGWEDILIANGHAHDFLDVDTRMRTQNLRIQDWRESRFLYPPLELQNVAFRNLGKDWQFEEVAEEWGFADGADIGHGLVTADLDGDGDLDIVVNRLGRPAAVYRNESSADRVAIRLRGTAPNTAGIGAKIRVLGGPVPIQSREVTAGGLYVSSSETLYTFATGDATAITIEVEWPSGTVTVIKDVATNTLYEISERPDTVPPSLSPTVPRFTVPLFSDVSDLLAHQHVDADYDDFARQPMLPNRLSRLGPGVAWSDLDRDGDEDLAVAGGVGGNVAVFRNVNGTFRPWSQYRTDTFDATGIVTVVANGRPALAIGQANYEATSPRQARDVAPVLLGISPNRARPIAGIAEEISSTGPLATADYDGDGDLDLFIGGRVRPGQYPAPASSALLRREGVRFVVDTVAGTTFDDVGLVSGAVFSDIDDDGDPDLLLAREWASIAVFRNDGGTFVEITDELGFGAFSGFWNGITTGDLNGDGRLDVVATNWGRNTKLRASAEYPIEVHYADFDRDGVLDVVLAQFDARLNAVVPLQGLDRLGEGMRYVRQRFPTFNRYADATLTDAIGPAITEAETRSVTTFDHMVFYNRGDRFEGQPLPLEAQLAPAFHVSVADFDGDGNEDVFISMNFFPTHDDTQRYDSGRGLLLLGDGAGNLEAVPGSESGIRVYGDQRGAAAGDFNNDGRTDLVISQNRGTTVLLQNNGADPGVRVRLVGTSGNPNAFGSTVQLMYGDRAGPLREVHGGSGYWSQDGPTQVLGRNGTPTAIRVKWPDGTRVEVSMEPGTLEIVVQWK